MFFELGMPKHSQLLTSVSRRVKIDDINVSSSECHFESLYHTIPSAHV